MTFAMNTGMRAGEIRGLKWAHIDREKGVIRLPAELTKENRDKTIPLNQNVRAILTDLTRTIHHDFVFGYKNEPIRALGNWRKSFSTACKSVGIPHGQGTANGVVFHDIRRTVKTNMVNAGVDQIHRDLFLGHSLKGMDVHYISPSEEDLHRAMAKYTARLDRGIANVDQTS